MKKVIIFLVIISLMLSVFTSCTSTTDKEQDNNTTSEIDWSFYNTRAETFVTVLSDGDYQSAVNMFDETMKQAYSVTALQNDWALVTAQAGAFSAIHEIENSTVDGYYICLVTSQHTVTGVTLRLVFSEDGLVAGMFIVDYPVIPENTQEPEQKDGFLEIPVVVGEGTEYPLNGMLTMPVNAEGKVPAVVLVHGSGPSNMNLEVYGITVFKDIAEYLSQNGIAVLRYDKRTFSHGAKLVQQFGSDMENFTVFDESIEDAIRAKELLAADERIDADNIFVVGLSLGGSLAPRIAEEGNFAGAVIMAGTMRSLSDVIFDQLMLQINLLEDEEERARQTALMQDAESWAAILAQLNYTGYYAEEMESHPAEEYLTTSQKPFLILQGGDDNQVYRDIDFVLYEKLAEGRDTIEIKLYDNLTHLFTPALVKLEDLTLENYLDITTYYVPGTKVAIEPLQDIVAWLNRVTAY